MPTGYLQVSPHLPPFLIRRLSFSVRGYASSQLSLTCQRPPRSPSLRPAADPAPQPALPRLSGTRYPLSWGMPGWRGGPDTGLSNHCACPRPAPSPLTEPHPPPLVPFSPLTTEHPLCSHGRWRDGRRTPSRVGQLALAGLASQPGEAPLALGGPAEACGRCGAAPGAGQGSASCGRPNPPALSSPRILHCLQDGFEIKFPCSQLLISEPSTLNIPWAFSDVIRVPCVGPSRTPPTLPKAGQTQTRRGLQGGSFLSPAGRMRPRATEGCGKEECWPQLAANRPPRLMGHQAGPGRPKLQEPTTSGPRGPVGHGTGSLPTGSQGRTGESPSDCPCPVGAWGAPTSLLADSCRALRHAGGGPSSDTAAGDLSRGPATQM